MEIFTLTLTTAHLFGLIAGVGVILAIWFLFHQDKRDENGFRLVDLLVDGRGASLSKIAQITALVVSTWAFVYLTVDGKLSEGYYLTYMATWSGSRLLSKYLDSKSSKEIV